MTVLYITKPGAKVGVKDGRLEIKFQDALLESIPFHTVERVAIMAPVQVSGAATTQLLMNQIPVLYYSMKGRFLGLLHNGSSNVETLLCQVERWQDSAYRLEIARRIIDHKIYNQYSVLRRQARNHQEAELHYASQELRDLQKKISTAECLYTLRGLEGYGAKVYFGVLGKCLRQGGMQFIERSRRPPLDEVNAMLSLGYMILLGEVVAALLEYGLHTGLGFLHEPSRRREALALDVIELFRQAVVDRFVLRMINLRVFQPEDFYRSEEDGVRLTAPALSRYLTEFENFLGAEKGAASASQSYRKVIRTEVSGLKKDLQQETQWRPVPLIS